MALRQLASVEAAIDWFSQRGVRELTTDSRRVQPGDAFVAWPGYAVDGRLFVGNALQAGAKACLVEAVGAEAFDWTDRPEVAALAGLKACTGALASGYMGVPSDRLDVIAVTGTNGKTSCAWWVAQALCVMGRRCGVVGTLGVGEPPTADRPAQLELTGLTTPDPVTLQTCFKRFVDAGFQVCAIEASSIGVAEQRLSGTHIDIALFTNFTQDHLDFHGSMEAYWGAKAELFVWPGLKAAVLNIDDPQGVALARQLVAGPLDVWTYSVSRAARLRASQVRYEAGGLCFDVIEGATRLAVSTRLVGEFNVSNLLAVIGGLRALGVPLLAATRSCMRLTPVPGRMQRVTLDSDATSCPDAVVDYAHTPDALEKALVALQPFAALRGGKLWCVFGCGGNRDATKRPLMGAIAQRLAHRVIVTSDNPRNESPDLIVSHILAGLVVPSDSVSVIEDRREAIRSALRDADARDVILIAGKGHEDYQEIRGVKHAFSDVAVVRAGLVLRGGAAW